MARQAHHNRGAERNEEDMVRELNEVATILHGQHYADTVFPVEALPITAEEMLDAERRVKEAADWAAANADASYLIAEACTRLGVTINSSEQLDGMVQWLRENGWYQAQANYTGQQVKGVRPLTKQPQRTGPVRHSRPKAEQAMCNALGRLGQADRYIESAFNELQDPGLRFRLMEVGQELRKITDKVQEHTEMLEGVRSYR